MTIIEEGLRRQLLTALAVIGGRVVEAQAHPLQDDGEESALVCIQ